MDGGGAVYVVDRGNHAVRRIGADGTIATLAGTGAPGFGGDGGVATSARLRSPRDVVVARDGAVFIADGGNDRVRRIDADGRIETIAGGGNGGDGSQATSARLDTPTAIAPLRDGGVMIADAGHAKLRKVSPDGRILTVAGTGTAGVRGDGGAAPRAQIDLPQALALGADDTIYMLDGGTDRVRAIAPTLPGLDLGEFTIASLDGRSLYVFDATGRHLRTVDALTKGTVLTFGYDTAGRLTSITDGDGRVTSFQRVGRRAVEDRRPRRARDDARGHERLPERDRQPGRRQDRAGVRRRRAADQAHRPAQRRPPLRVRRRRPPDQGHRPRQHVPDADARRAGQGHHGHAAHRRGPDQDLSHRAHGRRDDQAHDHRRRGPEHGHARRRRRDQHDDPPGRDEDRARGRARPALRDAVAARAADDADHAGRAEDGRPARADRRPGDAGRAA